MEVTVEDIQGYIDRLITSKELAYRLEARIRMLRNKASAYISIGGFSVDIVFNGVKENDMDLIREIKDMFHEAIFERKYNGSEFYWSAYITLDDKTIGFQICDIVAPCPLKEVTETRTRLVPDCTGFEVKV